MREGRIGSLGVTDAPCMYIGWINSKVRCVIAQGTIFNNPVKNKNGKEYVKEYVYTCKKGIESDIKKKNKTVA